jgi:hypothetical protein
MMQRFALLLFSLTLTLCTSAQNLVLNPGFEVQDTCPAVSEIHLAVPWDTPTFGTPDLFNSTCSTQNGPAHTGIGSSGVFLVGSFSNYREYIQGPLSATLVAGQTYCVSFWVRRSNFRYASDRVGAYFSDGAITGSGSGVLSAYTPQVQHTPGVPIASNDWVQIWGSFTASGGEDHITIGSFVNDATTDTLVVNAASDDAVAYYKIDDVSVTQCDVGIDEAGLSPADLEVVPQPATDRMTVRCERCTGTAHVRLIDAVGALRREERVQGLTGGVTLGVEDLGLGMYFIQVIVGDQVVVRPVAVH